MMRDLRQHDKTKELLIDFSKQPTAVSPITMDDDIVGRFEK